MMIRKTLPSLYHCQHCLSRRRLLMSWVESNLLKPIQEKIRITSQSGASFLQTQFLWDISNVSVYRESELKSFCSFRWGEHWRWRRQLWLWIGGWLLCWRNHWEMEEELPHVFLCYQRGKTPDGRQTFFQCPSIEFYLAVFFVFFIGERGGGGGFNFIHLKVDHQSLQHLKLPKEETFLTFYVGNDFSLIGISKTSPSFLFFFWSMFHWNLKFYEKYSKMCPSMFGKKSMQCSVNRMSVVIAGRASMIWAGIPAITVRGSFQDFVLQSVHILFSLKINIKWWINLFNKMDWWW